MSYFVGLYIVDWDCGVARYRVLFPWQPVGAAIDLGRLAVGGLLVRPPGGRPAWLGFAQASDRFWINASLFIDLGRPVSHYTIVPPRKVSRRPIIYRQKSAPPARLGETFLGRFYNGETFYRAGDILLRGYMSIP